MRLSSRLFLVLIALALFKGCVATAKEEPSAVKASIDREEIRKVIVAHRVPIRDCYEESLKTNPDLKAKLVLSWDIDDKGQVAKQVVLTNSMANEEVANCILNEIITLKFPPMPDGQIGRVQFPFVFTASDPTAKDSSLNGD